MAFESPLDRILRHQQPVHRRLHKSNLPLKWDGIDARQPIPILPLDDEGRVGIYALAPYEPNALRHDGQEVDALSRSRHVVVAIVQDVV
jgi:hypothetical protein